MVIRGNIFRIYNQCIEFEPRMTHSNGEIKSATRNMGLKFKKKVWN